MKTSNIKNNAYNANFQLKYQGSYSFYHIKNINICHQNPAASQNHAYWPNLSLLAIMPLCQSAIMPINHHPPLSASQNHNYRPSCLSAIMPIHPSDLCPAFTTFKPFWLVKGAFLIEAKQLLFCEVNFVFFWNYFHANVWQNVKDLTPYFDRHINQCVSSNSDIMTIMDSTSIL